MYFLVMQTTRCFQKYTTKINKDEQIGYFDAGTVDENTQVVNVLKEGEPFEWHPFVREGLRFFVFKVKFVINKVYSIYSF